MVVIEVHVDVLMSDPDPSIQDKEYPYFGTNLDTIDHLQTSTNYKTMELAVAAAQVAGQMALKLAHDHLLPLNVERYARVIRKHVADVNGRIGQLREVSQAQNLKKMMMFRFFFFVCLFVCTHIAFEWNTFVLYILPSTQGFFM